MTTEVFLRAADAIHRHLQSGWTHRVVGETAVSTADVYLNLDFTPNVFLNELPIDQAGLLAPSASAIIMRSLASDGKVWGQQLTVEVTMGIPVTTEILVLHAGDKAVQVTVSAAIGDVHAVANVVDAVLESMNDGGEK